MVGRPPKPVQIKKLEGNPGKRAINKAMPQPAGEVVMPQTVKGYGVKVWERIIAAMPDRVYTSVDVELLAQYCIAVEQRNKALQMIRKEGQVITDRFGESKPNPWNAVYHEHCRTIVSVGGRLGLDPAARQSLTVPPKEGNTSKFEGLVNLKKVAG